MLSEAERIEMMHLKKTFLCHLYLGLLLCSLYTHQSLEWQIDLVV